MISKGIIFVLRKILLKIELNILALVCFCLIVFMTYHYEAVYDLWTNNRYQIHIKNPETRRAIYMWADLSQYLVLVYISRNFWKQSLFIPLIIIIFIPNYLVSNIGMVVLSTPYIIGAKMLSIQTKYDEIIYTTIRSLIFIFLFRNQLRFFFNSHKAPN